MVGQAEHSGRHGINLGPPRRLRGPRGVAVVRKIIGGLWVHRRVYIFKNEKGIYVEDHLELFKTLADAREFINKILDGTNKKEPVVVGTWEE